MSANKVTLYSYFRSSCAWRVRAALAFKDIAYDYKAVPLIKSDGQPGDQFSDEFRRLNPNGYVPVLLIDGLTLFESLAIIEYLDETRPDAGTGRLLPTEAAARAKVREIALMIVSGIQPLQNSLPLSKLPPAQDKGEWARFWIERGFTALEKVLTETAGKCCYGDRVTVADLTLVPQIYNANRFNVDMAKYPTISRVHSHLVTMKEFASTHPDNQPDTPN